MGSVNASVHAGMATVVVSVIAAAGGGGFESELEWEMEYVLRQEKKRLC